MEITVLFFSVFRDLVGTDRLRLELPDDPITVSEVAARIRSEHPGLEDWKERTLLALNCNFARGDEPVEDGDELALMPPVQGG